MQKVQKKLEIFFKKTHPFKFFVLFFLCGFFFILKAFEVEIIILFAICMPVVYTVCHVGILHK